MDGYDALTAARDSAYWAAAAALAAWLIGLITLIVNGGGILLLWRQLKISEDAALAARDAVRIAAAEARPWLQVTLPEAEGAVTDKQAIRIIGKVAVSNIGKTPAMNVWISSRLLVNPVRNDVRVALQEMREEKLYRHPVIFPGQVLTRTTYDRVELKEDDFGRTRDVKLAVLVRYSSGSENHVTPMVRDVWPADDDVAEIIGWSLVPAGTKAVASSSAFDYVGDPT